MPYDIGTDPYLDPISGVLRNSLGITSSEELAKAEANITTVAICVNPIRLLATLAQP